MEADRILVESERKKSWTIGIFLTVAIGGAVFQTRGPFLSSFEATFGVSKSVLGLMPAASSISFLTSVIVFGMRSGKINIKRHLLVGILLNGIFVFLFGLAPTFLILLGFFIGEGLAAGVQGGLGRPLLGHFFPKRRGWIYNLYDLFWAVGAASGPLFANLFLNIGNWRWAYIILAIGFIPIIVLLRHNDMPSVEHKEKPLDFEKFGKILKNPKIIALISLIVLNSGVEGITFTWLPYFAEQYFSRTISNVILSIFIGAYIPGRLLHSWLSEQTEYRWIILVDSLLLIPAVLVTFVFSAGGYLMIIAACISGFLISGIFPTVLAYGTDEFPQYSGPINSLAMSSSTVGISLFSAIVGLTADVYTIEKAMYIPAILVFLVFILGFLTNISHKK
ncbi:MAG: MFS transporter [Candidatus Hadarchaeia archaeon]